MTAVHDFTGTTLCSAPCLLGEGPTYDPATDTAWWLNIIGRELHELQIGSGAKTVHALPFMASVVAAIDADRQLIVSDEGLFIREIASGALMPSVVFEPGKPDNRSNDGRVHPSGALWIGTMGRRAEDRAGAIYHIAAGQVTVLVDAISIPNAICFSADGATGYFVDSRVNILMRVSLDPATGLPSGKPEAFLDKSGEPDIDGAVIDAQGAIWAARWGAGAVDRFDAKGTHLDRYLLPASLTTCPAFIGTAADRLLVTSAWQGLDDDARAKDPHAGETFALDIPVKGLHAHAYRL